MSEPDFRKMGDPMNDRLPPNDNLLNRRRRKDLARNVMCDEIDHLRAESAAFRDLAGCCSDCEWEGVEIVHRPMCARWQSAEIAEVADRIANGHATCGATWRDTEATGWLWYCSLPVGHAGHHRCVGASW